MQQYFATLSLHLCFWGLRKIVAFIASQKGHCDVVDILLKNGANINQALEVYKDLHKQSLQ